MVMVGAASHCIPLSQEALTAAVKHLVPPKTIEMNLKAYQLGRDAAAGCW
jgi:indolepyruvate ferredoxin oxidoreductase beta subunit